MSYSYNLPLEINQVAFETMDFADRNYMAGFPSIMGAMSAQSYNASWSDARSIYDPRPYGQPQSVVYKQKDYVYTSKGLQSIYLQPGKGFVPGADIRIYNKNSAANPRTIISARVESYDAKTGLMWFDCYAVNIGADFGTPENSKIPINSVRVSLYGAKVVNSPVRSIATGGTGGTTYLEALAALGSRQSRDISELFHDFLSPAEGPAHVWNASAQYLNVYGQAQNDPANHPGIISLGGLTTTASNRTKTLMLSSSPRYETANQGGAPICTMTSGCVFETLVWQPALSTATNEYEFEIGLKFNAAIGEAGKLLFNYRRLSNTAWRCLGQMATGSISTTNTTSIVASGWYKFRIEFDGTAFRFFINGANLATMTLASLGAGVNGTLSGFYIYARQNWIAGVTPFHDIDYVYLKKAYSPRRTG